MCDKDVSLNFLELDVKSKIDLPQLEPKASKAKVQSKFNLNFSPQKKKRHTLGPKRASNKTLLKEQGEWI